LLRGHADQVLRTRGAADGIFKHPGVSQKDRRATSHRRDDFGSPVKPSVADRVALRLGTSDAVLRK